MTKSYNTPRGCATRTSCCLILAAGKGTRLRKASHGLPKPLVHFRGKPILEHIILAAHQAGINRFVIVVGYGSEFIRRWFNNRFRGKVSVTWVENAEYEKQNGISALKAKDELHENFLLLMADHVFQPQTARVMLEQPLSPGEVILAVDTNIEDVFDLDDATKVQRQGDYIVDIGKEIVDFDALDTGMFLCSPALFDTLQSVVKNGNCSLSDGMRQLAQNRRLRALDIGEAGWQDLDTPEALAHAEGSFGAHDTTTAVPLAS
jgi:choline kinase